jgi:pyruvate,orthophosphate dikinase
LARNIVLLPSVVESLQYIADNDGSILKKSSGYLKRTLKLLFEHGVKVPMDSLAMLLFKIFKDTYQFWFTQPDPSGWFHIDGESEDAIAVFGELTSPLSHAHLCFLSDKVHAINASLSSESEKACLAYADMPDYWQIVNGYLMIADELEKSNVFAGRQNFVKLDFLFNIMGMPGLSDIHGSALREINLSLRMVFREDQKENLDEFVRKVFSLLKKSVGQHEFRSAIIDCITTIAREVFNQNKHPLVDTFIEEVIAFGFQYPEVKGSTAEWQVQVNPAHVMNVRSWLEII